MSSCTDVNCRGNVKGRFRLAGNRLVGNETRSNEKSHFSARLNEQTDNKSESAISGVSSHRVITSIHYKLKLPKRKIIQAVSIKMAEVESTNPEEILGTYKRMLAECQQIASKISEVCCVVALCTMVLFTIDTDTKS